MERRLWGQSSLYFLIIGRPSLFSRWVRGGERGRGITVEVPWNDIFPFSINLFPCLNAQLHILPQLHGVFQDDVNYNWSIYMKPWEDPASVLPLFPVQLRRLRGAAKMSVRKEICSPAAEWGARTLGCRCSWHGQEGSVRLKCDPRPGCCPAYSKVFSGTSGGGRGCSGGGG